MTRSPIRVTHTCTMHVDYAVVQVVEIPTMTSLIVSQGE